MKALPTSALLILLCNSAFAIDDAAVRQCRSLNEAQARLACYDALPLTDTSPTATAKPAPAASTEQFGLQRPPGQIDAIQSHIPGRFEGWRPQQTLRLANGQLWQISDDSSGVHGIENPKVTIRRGFMGAFYMEIEGRTQAPRVQRLR